MNQLFGEALRVQDHEIFVPGYSVKNKYFN